MNKRVLITFELIVYFNGIYNFFAKLILSNSINAHFKNNIIFTSQNKVVRLFLL